ncbi:uncharacterized protein LOC133815931 [Humulus lupulus]|uniref:uncharacterized protein LOC133815931 n=1 Tax=Humulus lupulus TaxID=3486 RepID=UPI002B4155FC|nr:uncharacterized protein LOC133815931 [Humulus lupulus]
MKMLFKPLLLVPIVKESCSFFLSHKYKYIYIYTNTYTRRNNRKCHVLSLSLAYIYMLNAFTSYLLISLSLSLLSLSVSTCLSISLFQSINCLAFGVIIMGNCITNKHQISGEDVDYDHEVRDSKKELSEAEAALSPSKLEDLKKLAKKKNRVRFKVEEEEDHQDGEPKCSSSIGGADHKDSKSGVVRIRLVVTQEELKQILNYKKNKDSKVSSVEQLLSEMKLSRRSRVLEVDEKSSDHGSWSPALESIPEDH